MEKLGGPACDAFFGADRVKMMNARRRVCLRRWLRIRGIAPALGDRPAEQQRLVAQVQAAGGDHEAIIRD